MRHVGFLVICAQFALDGEEKDLKIPLLLKPEEDKNTTFYSEILSLCSTHSAFKHLVLLLQYTVQTRPCLLLIISLINELFCLETLSRNSGSNSSDNKNSAMFQHGIVSLQTTFINLFKVFHKKQPPLKKMEII